MFDISAIQKAVAAATNASLSKTLEINESANIKADTVNKSNGDEVNTQVEYSDRIKRIVISENCVACGNCTLTTSYIEEGIDGKAIPIEPGYISNMKISELEDVIESCPVKAISLVNAGMVSSDGIAGLKELKEIINHRLTNFKIPFPQSSEYEFNKAEYSTPTAYASGEYRYEYKSSDQAERAGLREFDRIMYSQSKAIIQQIIIDYKNRKLRKYAYYDREPGNFYYDNNKAIEKILKEIVIQAKIIADNKLELPSEFEIFDVEPDMGINGDSFNRELYMYQVRHLEELWFVQNILNERESLSWYQTYIDYDDREDSRGKDVYCYKNISEVCSKFGQYLLNDTQYCLTGSDGVRKVIEDPINRYSKKAESALNTKIDFLIKEIDRLISNL